MGKLFLYVGGVAFVLLTLVFVADYFLNIPLARSIPGLNQITCQFPVTVSGQSMEPAIKAGSRVTFNKCFENRENLPTGTVVLFNNERGNIVSRIKDKIQNTQGRLVYKIGQDNRQDANFEVPPEKIVAVWEQ